MDQEARLDIWRALSELFLDTELNDSTYQFVATIVHEGQYSISQVEHMLWQEVFPALAKNLNSLAGVWDGWPDEWLLSNLKICKTTKQIPDSDAAKQIQQNWAKVQLQLQRIKGNRDEI